MMNEIVKKKKDLRIKLTERRNLAKRNSTLDFNRDVFYQLTEKIKFNAKRFKSIENEKKMFNYRKTTWCI